MVGCMIMYLGGQARVGKVPLSAFARLGAPIIASPVRSCPRLPACPPARLPRLAVRFLPTNCHFILCIKWQQLTTGT